ncbi:hypothetical protein Tco_0323253 [Tanacetum coccineum]
MLDLEQLMRGFLWCQGDMRRGKSKVAWEVVCLPKKEGGLGLRRLEVFNKALITTHILSILTLKESLVICHEDEGKSCNFNLRQFIWRNLGDGNKASLWFDRWSSLCPLSQIVTSWPNEWYLKYPLLNSLTVPNLIPNSLDWLFWLTHNGVESDFSVSIVWDSIRPKSDGINWYDLVWFSHAIPRHAFHLWLVIKRKLKTQDLMRQWDDHLKVYAGLPNATASLDSIINPLIPMSRKRAARSVIAKLVFVASSYFIWQERNNRLFANQKRSKDQLIDIIKSTVRLKLLTCSFKRTANVEGLRHFYSFGSYLPRLSDLLINGYCVYRLVVT